MSLIETLATDLLSTLSTGEIISVTCMMAAVVYYTIKFTLKARTFVEDVSKEDREKGEKATSERRLNTDIKSLNEKVGIILSMVTDTNKSFDQVQDVERNLNYQVATINEKLTEMKNIFDSRLIALNDQMVDTYKEVDEKLTDAQNIHRDLISNLTALKSSIDRLEQFIQNISSENKELHQESLRQIQSVSKDLATLQGTIIGNMSIGRANLR